jgi:hypothetical protein
VSHGVRCGRHRNGLKKSGPLPRLQLLPRPDRRDLVDAVTESLVSKNKLPRSKDSFRMIARNKQQVRILSIIVSTGMSVLAATAIAQSDPGFKKGSDEELVKQLSNPVSSLISVPFQNNFDFNLGTGHGWRYTLNFQPVVPIKLDSSWTLIVRTIVPFIHQEDLFKGALDQVTLPDDVVQKLKGIFGRTQSGLGDITQSFFFSPTNDPLGITVGLGPAFLYPTAADELLGTGKWGAGPTAVVLKQFGGWTVGALMNHIWSFAGDDDRAYVSRTFLQPFVAYATKSKTTFTINTEASYDWHAGQWTVPINLMVSQLVRVGRVPVSFAVGARYYAEAPSTGPDWGLRFVVTPLFPTNN